MVNPKKGFFTRVLIPLVIVLLSTCDVGIGSQVDVARPGAALESHNPGDYLRGVVTLQGTATDDIGVVGVEVSVNGGISFSAVPADNLVLRGKTAEWSYDLDTRTLADGPISVVVNAADGSGRIAQTDTLVFNIDNTPPVLVVSSPRNYESIILNTQAVLTLEVSDISPLTSYGFRVWSAVASDPDQTADSPSLLWEPVAPEYAPKIVERSGSPFVYSFSSLPYTRDLGTPRKFFRFALWATDRAGNTSTSFYHGDEIYPLNENQTLSAVELSQILGGQPKVLSGGGVLQAQDLIAVAHQADDSSDFVLLFDEEFDIPKVGLTYPSVSSSSPDQWPTVSSSDELQGYFQDDDGIDLATVTLFVDRLVSGDGSQASDWSENVQSISISDLDYQLNSEIGNRRVDWQYSVAGIPAPNQGRFRLRTQVQDVNGTPSVPFSRNLIVSDGRPSISVEPPTSGYLSDTLTLEGNASHAIPLDGVQILIGYGSSVSPTWVYDSTDDLWAQYGQDPAEPTKWTFNFPIPVLPVVPEGTIIVEARAMVGSEFESRQVTFVRDTQAPEGGFLSPASESSLNEVAVITGFADDNRSGVEKLEFRVGAPGTWWEFNSDSGGPTLGVEGYEFEGTQSNFVFKFDSTDFADDILYPIWLRVTDRAGNEYEADRSYRVYQDSDLPELSLLNVDASSSAVENILSGVPGRILGTALDDDGFLDGTGQVVPGVLQYRVRSFDLAENPGPWSNWGEVTNPSPNGAKELGFSLALVHPDSAVSLSDGIHEVQIWAQDRNGIGLTRGTRETGGVIIPFAIDNGPPTLAFLAPTPAPGASVPGSLPFGIAASDALGLQSVQVQVDGPSTPAPLVLFTAGPDRVASQTFTNSIESLSTGTYTLTVTATDLAGSTGSINRTLIVDRDIPSASITTPESGAEVNGIVLLRGGANDIQRVDRVHYALLPALQNPPLDKSTWEVAEGTYSWSIEWDTTSANNGAEYILHVSSQDPAGNWSPTVTRSFQVDQGSDLPRVDFTDLNPSIDEASLAGIGGVNLLDFGPRIRGTLVDDDGFDTGSMEVRINSTLEGDWQSFSGTLGNNGLSVSFSYNLSLPEGIHYFFLRFSDDPSVKAGLPAATTTIGPIYFAIDTAPPVISFTSPVPGSYQGGVFELQGIATDGNGLSPEILVRTPADSSWAEATAVTLAGNGSWAVSIDDLFTGAWEGPRTIQVQGTDIFQKSTVSTFNILVDTLAPGVTIENPVVDGWLQGISGSVTGQASDTGVVGGVYFWLDDRGIAPPADRASWTTASGTSSWNGTFNLLELGEGLKTLHVQAVDGAGNESPIMTRDFGVDQNSPGVTETIVSSPSAARSAFFSLGGSFTDSNSIYRLRISQQKGSGDFVTIFDEDSFSGNSSPWILSDLPRDPDAPDPTLSSSALLTDGVYSYLIHGEDTAGKVQSLSRIITVDLTGPGVTINQPGVAAVVNGTSLAISGTSNDLEDVSPIAEVRYWVGGPLATPPASYLDWTLASGGASWTGVLDLQALGEGNKVLWMVARDSAGNWSPGPSQRTFIVDQDVPSITEDILGVSGPTLFRNGPFSLGGSVSDTNGLTQVEVFQGANLVATLPVTGTSSSWQLDNLPDGAGLDSPYTYTLRVTDAAGRTTSINRSLTLDTTDPTVTLGTLSPIVGSNRVNGLVSGSATASDINGVQELRWWFLPQIDSQPSFDDPLGTTIPDGTSSLSIDTTQYLDGDYRLWILAKDRADNLGVATRDLVVDQESDGPVFAFGFAPGTVYNDSPFTLGGSITDDDGIASIDWRVSGVLEWTPIAQWTENFPLSTNWSITVDSLADGVDRTIELRGTDAVGATVFATTVASSPTFSLLTQSPIIEMTSPIAGSYVNGSSDILLSGTAYVDTNVFVQQLEYQIDNDGWVSFYTGLPTGPVNYSVPIPSSSFNSKSDGILRLRVRALGTNDKVSIETVEIQIDKTIPDLFFSFPSEGAVINGSIDVGGTATDTNLVDRVRLEVVRSATGLVVQTYEDLGQYTWALSSPLDTLGLQDDEQFILRATAFDGAGNTRVRERVVNVDQDSDTPQLTFSNLALDGSTLFVGNGNILGTAIDDDGVQRIDYRFNAGAWENLNLGGTTQENFSISYSGLPEGANTVEIRVYDTVGLSAGTYVGGTINFGIDRLAPSASILGPVADSFQTSPFSLNGNATDANSVIAVEYRVGDTGTFSPVDEYISATGAWSHEVTYPGPDGNARVYIQVTDRAERTTTVNRQFAFDTTAPTLSFIGPGESGVTTVNRDIEIFGTSTDFGSGVDSVQIFAVRPSDGNLADLGTVNGTGTWSLDFDTTRVTEVAGDLYGYAEETALGSGVWHLTLRALAQDATGNSATLDRIIQIDQTTNRPTLEFSNFAIDGTSLFASRVNILGTVSDDEGVDYFEYRFNGGPWTRVELGNGPSHGLSIPLTSLSDGPYTLEVLVQDTVGGIESALTFGPVGFVLDTAPPSLSFVTPGSNSYQNDEILLRVSAADANGIQEVRSRIGSLGPWIIGSDLGDGTYSMNLDPTSLSQGLHTIFVEVEDNSGIAGRITQSSRDFTYDSVAPVISVLNPESGANVNGQISILGTAQDESGISGTQYRIGNQGDLNDGWIPFANRLNWNTGNILINQYGTSEYGVEITPNVWEVPILLRTTDNAGNQTLLSTYYLEVDPDGDRPFVQILQPGDGDTVGGRVRLSGTSQDDDSVYSVEVAFDMNNDGLYNGPGDLWPAPAAGWDPGQEPLVSQSDIDTTGWYSVEAATADWSNWFINLNSSGEFDPEPGETRQIGIKVRSIDTKDGINPGIPGNPAYLDLTFDSNAPRIENMNYQTGDIVGGQIVFRGLVKDPTGLESFRWIRGTSSTFLVNNSTTLLPGQITLLDSADPDYESGISTYRFAIPVDTTTITSSGPGFFTFEAAKGNYISQVYVNLQIDNLAPTGNFTSPETIDVAGSSYALLSGTNYTLQGTANDSGSVSGVRSVAVFLEDENGDYYDLRTNLYGDPRGVTRAPILASALVAGETYLILDPGTTDFLSLGALRNTRGTVFTASNSGSGTGTLLPAPYFALIDTFNEEGQDIVENKGDQDGFKENLSLAGGTVNWYWQFDSNLLSDGPVTIHYEVVDQGLNSYSSSVNGFVANNRPVIDSLVLGTDLGGDGLTDGSGERVEFFGSYGSTNFTIRNGIFFYEVRGTLGNGTQTYTLDYWNGSTYIPLISSATPEGILDDFVTPGISDTIVNGTEQPNSAQFRVRVTDSLGLSSSAILGLNIDNIDTISPTSRLFQLTATDRPLDNFGRPLGHIEPWELSPFDNGVLGADADADVSGSVIFRGEAWDNQRLDSLWIAIELSPGVLSRERVAQADPVTGLLVPSANTLGTLEIDSQSLTQDLGHSVSFSFQWNSATILGVVRSNLGIQVESQDAGANLSTIQPLLNTLQVDVVPYISRVSTAHRPNLGGLKDQNIRTTDGRYTLTTGTSTDFIRVSGFNLSPIPDGVRVSSSAFPTGLDGTTLVGDSLAFSNQAPDFTSLDLSNVATGSGYLSIVGGTLAEPVPSLNNINSNDQDNNKEEDLLVAKNRLWTDDRYLQFYSTSTTGITSATYPNMIMDGDTPVWGYVQSGAANDQMVRRGTTGASNTPLTRILAGDQLAMTRDEGGRYHMISVNNFSQGRILYFNDEFTAVSGDGAFTSPYWSGHAGTNTGATGNNAIQMESVNQAPGLKLGRYVRPVIRSIGDSTLAGEHAKLFMLYFDNASNELLFRNWQVGQTVTNQAQTLSGTYRSNLGENNTTGRQVLSNSASEHFTMAVTDLGVVIVGYYDQATSQFVIRYSSTTANGSVAQPLAAANPATVVTWSAPILVPQLYLGWYPSMTVDGDGRIHIAAYDSSTASLGYILMDTYDDPTPQVVTVDTFNSVGYYTDIQLGPDGLPWIAYYNVSETGTRDSVRLARYLGALGTALEGVDSQDFVTGNWEVETVPVASVPNGASSNFLKVNLGFTTGGTPTLGYAGTGLEFSQPLPAILP